MFTSCKSANQVSYNVLRVYRTRDYLASGPANQFYMICPKLGKQSDQSVSFTLSISTSYVLQEVDNAVLDNLSFSCFRLPHQFLVWVGETNFCPSFYQRKSAPSQTYYKQLNKNAAMAHRMFTNAVLELLSQLVELSHTFVCKCLDINNLWTYEEHLYLLLRPRETKMKKRMSRSETNDIQRQNINEQVVPQFLNNQLKIISDFALFVWPILFGQTNFYQMLKADTKKCYNKSLIGQMVRKEVTYTEIMRQLTRESDSSAKKIVINIDPSFDRQRNVTPMRKQFSKSQYKEKDRRQNRSLDNMKRPNNDKYSLNNKKTVTVREQNSNNQREKYSPCSFSQPKTNLKLDHDVFQHHIRQKRHRIAWIRSDKSLLTGKSFSMRIDKFRRIRSCNSQSIDERYLPEVRAKTLNLEKRNTSPPEKNLLVHLRSLKNANLRNSTVVVEQFLAKPRCLALESANISSQIKQNGSQNNYLNEIRAKVMQKMQKKLKQVDRATITAPQSVRDKSIKNIIPIPPNTAKSESQNEIIPEITRKIIWGAEPTESSNVFQAIQINPRQDHPQSQRNANLQARNQQKNHKEKDNLQKAINLPSKDSKQIPRLLQQQKMKIGYIPPFDDSIEQITLEDRKKPIAQETKKLKAEQDYKKLREERLQPESVGSNVLVTSSQQVKQTRETEDIVQDFVTLVNILGDVCVKTTKISHKMSDSEWKKFVYFIYERFFHERKIIQNSLQQCQKILHRSHEALSLQRWKLWFESNEGKAMRNRIRAQNQIIKITLDKLTNRVLKIGKLPKAVEEFIRGRQTRSQEEYQRYISQEAMTIIITKYDELEDQQVRQESDMNHLLDMVFAARILAELDGMGQEFPNSKQQSALPRVHLEDYRNYGCHFDDLKDLIDKIEDLYFPVRAR